MDAYHIVAEADRARIRCKDCGESAHVCEHMHWKVGRRPGVSFFYYCLMCAIRRGLGVA